MIPARRIFCLLASLSVGAVASYAHANEIYIYTGNPYTQAQAPYLVGERVSGLLELTQALPNNLAATDVPRANVVRFDFSDAHQNRVFANTTVCRLVLGTDAQGEINAWNFWMRESTAGAGNSRFSLETYNVPGFVGDFAGSGVFPNACDSGALSPRASTLSPGQWLRDSLLADGFESD